MREYVQFARTATSTPISCGYAQQRKTALTEQPKSGDNRPLFDKQLVLRQGTEHISASTCFICLNGTNVRYLPNTEIQQEQQVIRQNIRTIQCLQIPRALPLCHGDNIFIS